jgi:hypothetical protein
MKVRKITRKPRGGRGMISGPAMRDSAGSFLRMPIFSAFDNSLSPILVWTQLPTVEASVFAVLALLASMPVAALAAVEPLLPIAVVLSKNSTGMEMRERCRWSGA